MKYWIKPDIENRIKNGEIKAYFNSTVKEITADSVVLTTAEGERRLANDFVLALIGYHPDFEFLQALGIRFGGGRLSPGEPRNPGEQCAGNLSGGRDHCRQKNERNLHRERPLPRGADRAGFDEEVAAARSVES